MNRQLKPLTTIVALFLTVSLAPFALGQVKAPAKSAEKPAGQAPAPRQLISIQFLRIKSGMAAEWREFRKNETIPALQKAGVKQQTVWGTSIFGEGGLIIVTPIESLSQYDNPGPFRRALGDEGARVYNEKAARFVDNSHAIAIETRPEMSILASPGTEYKLAVITTNTIAPGRAEDYETYVKTSLMPVIKKAAPKGFLISRVVYGGVTNQYVSALLVDSWADLQRFREAAAKEAAAAKLTGKVAGIVTQTENAIYRFAPDLSIVPAPQKAENK